MLFTPTKLRELCKQYGLTPSKRYGQNFLITDWSIKKMIEAADLQKTDTVIEIGPGFGALTFALASAAKKVIAFEIERRLEEYWRNVCHPERSEGFLKQNIRDSSTPLRSARNDICGNLEIVWGNALVSLRGSRFASADEAIPSLADKAKGLPRPARAGLAMTPYKVVANLPYQITSNALRTLLELENKPESIAIMVQKEVAERICAKPPDMSLLAVSVQYYGEPKIIAKVSKGNFWPEPKVDSAILRIKTKPLPFPPLQGEGRVGSGEFFRVVRAGFANKRKQLWKNISTVLKLESYKVKSAIGETVGDEKARAEELSVENWIEIVKKLSN